MGKAAAVPGPLPLRILSWNIGSYYSQGDSLLELLGDLRIDMALIQEHRVSPQARAKVCRDLRAKVGWHSLALNANAGWRSCVIAQPIQCGAVGRFF